MSDGHKTDTMVARAPAWQQSVNASSKDRKSKVPGSWDMIERWAVGLATRARCQPRQIFLLKYPTRLSRTYKTGIAQCPRVVEDVDETTRPYIH